MLERHRLRRFTPVPNIGEAEILQNAREAAAEILAESGTCAPGMALAADLNPVLASVFTPLAFPDHDMDMGVDIQERDRLTRRCVRFIGNSDQ